jgi:hypothetical protein
VLFSGGFGAGAVYGRQGVPPAGHWPTYRNLRVAESAVIHPEPVSFPAT